MNRRCTQDKPVPPPRASQCPPPMLPAGTCCASKHTGNQHSAARTRECAAGAPGRWPSLRPCCCRASRRAGCTRCCRTHACRPAPGRRIRCRRTPGDPGTRCDIARASSPVNNDIAGILRRMQPRWQLYRGSVRHRATPKASQRHGPPAIPAHGLAQRAATRPAP